MLSHMRARVDPAADTCRLLLDPQTHLTCSRAAGGTVCVNMSLQSNQTELIL